MTQRGKSGGFAPPALGGASLLVIFAVLALTVFALLSLSTVRADVRLGDASAQAVVNYYAADGRAQEILACLRTGATAPEDIPVSVSIIHYEDRVERVCSYTVPISETQELQVEVQLEGTDYTVLRWQAVPAGGWEIDEGIELWDMEMF